MGCCYSEELKTFPYSQPNIGIANKRRIIKSNNASSAFSDDKIIQNVSKIEVNITSQERQLVGKVIAQHFLLYRLPKNERNRLIDCIQIYQCSQGSTIFKKGDNATLFFIIRSGSVSIVSQDSKTQNNSRKDIKLSKGSYFGDLALLYTAVRSATVKSLTDCTFFCISNLHFRRMVQEIVKKNYHLSKIFIEKAPLFMYLSQRQKNIVAYNSHFLRFDKDQVIFREGDDANSIYIITSGKVQIKISGKKSLQMKTGQSFGENSFGENQKRFGTAIALQLTSLLSISSESLKNYLGNQLQEISFYNILKWAFNRNDILKQATKLQTQELISSAELKQYRNQQIICTQGEKADSIVIVLQQKINNKEVGTVFNTQFLIKDNQSQINQHNLKMSQRLVKNGKGYVAIIKLKTIYSIMGKKLQQISQKQNNLSIFNKQLQEIKKLQLSDFTIVSKIGEGQFGKIFEVTDKKKKVYSLKCLNKQKINAANMQGFILKQKQILKLVQSPYIIRLYKTYKDQQYVYILTNLIEGVDFFDVLREIGICNKKKAQFFIACIVIALQNLHEKSILYRDLKPQNLVIDQQGYPNIVDVKISKILNEQNGFRTFTVVGTPHYMAPQVMEVQGYSFPADMWSLGILLFQMVCGYLPFGNETDDPYQIFKQIDTKELQFPDFYVDKPGKQLMCKLLIKNPHQRFNDEFFKIKNMQYFQNLNWGSLQQKTFQTPFKLKQNRSKKYINLPFVQYFKKQKGSISAKTSRNINIANEKRIVNWQNQF